MDSHQQFLDIIASKDTYGFLKDVENWHNHRIPLYLSLTLTSGKILECGMGDGSTHHLHKYSSNTGRKLVSFDTSLDWAIKFKHYSSELHTVDFVPDSSELDKYLQEQMYVSVALIDHASGERRHSDVLAIKDQCEIIVIHDSEPAAYGYMMDKVWGSFKHILDYRTEGAWATAVSNVIDLNPFDKCKLGGYLLEKR